MERQIKSWRELSDTIQSAQDFCDMCHCEPCGTATLEQLGPGIARLVISVDLVPTAILDEDNTVLTCPIHKIILTQSFSRDEARNFLDLAQKLGICLSCREALLKKLVVLSPIPVAKFPKI